MLGATIVVYGLSDIFLTLVHPHARGRLTRGIVAGVWNATSAVGRRARAASGPLAALSVVLAWAAVQAVGWALIYFPTCRTGSLPRRHRPGTVSECARGALLLARLAVDLGFGEVVPIGPRSSACSRPIQAVTGFALLTGRRDVASAAVPDARPPPRDGTVPHAARSRALPAARWASWMPPPPPASVALRRAADRQRPGRPQSEPGVVLLPRGRGADFARPRAADRPGARRGRARVDRSRTCGSPAWCSTRRWRTSARACGTTSGPHGESRADVMESFARDHS